MIDNNTGRTWGNAPSIVRESRVLAWLSVIVLVLVLSMAFASPEFRAAIGLPYLITWIVFLLLEMWLIGALKRGTKAAYYVEVVASLIGLLNFPIGTVISAYILFKWFRPETRAWFMV